MSETFRPVTQPFSAEYDLVLNAEIIQYNDEEAIMDRTMFDSLCRRFGKGFLGFIGGLHYDFKPMESIPRGAVAIPADNHDDPDALLIQK